VVKAINFQTSDYQTFVTGYIQQSIISSLVNRLIVQSLLPILMMKMSEKKKSQANVKLSADQV
jgi:hypothetical protein